jgi:hypothetical protein
VNDHAVAGSGNDPMKILKALVQGNAGGQPWVTPMNNSYWFAAGLTLIAFDILSVTAVAMVQFRQTGLIISVIADAVAQMPPGVTSRSEMIVYVEIGFIAELNTVDGYFRVEAALAPTSFLLVPQCKIYGGIALVYWFSVSVLIPFSASKLTASCSRMSTQATGCSPWVGIIVNFKYQNGIQPCNVSVSPSTLESSPSPARLTSPLLPKSPWEGL